MGNAQIKRDGGNGGAKDAAPKVVLVGTYRGDQLARWRGWYCWPMSNEELKIENGELSGKGAAPNSQFSIFNFQFVTELWLFKGTAEQKTYKAEFIGFKTRDELIRNYGYLSWEGRASSRPNARGARSRATAKPHGTHYALFKTELLYRHKNDLPEEADAVIIRTKDFAASPKVRKQLKAYLESPDRKDPDLAKLLPSIVTKLPSERLKVCEGAVQLRFWDIPEFEILLPSVPFPPLRRDIVRLRNKE